MRIQSIAVAIAVAIAPVLGCDLGALNPPEDSVRLTAADIATAEGVGCANGWVTGDPAQDVPKAIRRFEEIGIPIVDNPGNPFSTAMAKQSELWVESGFFRRPLDVQARVLAHELVHYCQRAEMGDDAFDGALVKPVGRWRAEVPAYREQFRVMRLQGWSPSKLDREMRKRLGSMRATYSLGGIEREQYEAETLRIWRTELEG